MDLIEERKNKIKWMSDVLHVPCANILFWFWFCYIVQERERTNLISNLFFSCIFGHVVESSLLVSKEKDTDCFSSLLLSFEMRNQLFSTRSLVFFLMRLQISSFLFCCGFLSSASFSFFASYFFFSIHVSPGLEISRFVFLNFWLFWYSALFFFHQIIHFFLGGSHFGLYSNTEYPFALL